MLLLCTYTCMYAMLFVDIGVLPDGVYNRNTKIFFCCRSDRHASYPIVLPTRAPFYLLKFGRQCQTVCTWLYQDICTSQLLPRAGCKNKRAPFPGCRKSQLNQALSVLSQPSIFLECVYCVVIQRRFFLHCLILCYLCVLSLSCSCQVVSTTASD